MLSVLQKLFVARQLNRGLRLVRRLAGRDMHVRCRRRGVNWNLDLDEGIDLSIYLLGAYEPRTLRAYRPLIRPGAVAFDIGANIGAHTLHFARLVGPTGRVHAFEPTDYACGKLRRNLQENPDLEPRVALHQTFLVADAAQRPPAAIPSSWPVTQGTDGSDAGRHAGHLGKPQTLVAAQAMTLDAFCAAERITRLDIVKLDVDGHEYPVLRGGRECLARFRPVILIELAPYIYESENAGEFEEFVHFLAGLNYRFIEANSGRPTSSDPAELRRIITPGGGMNALLLPSDA